MRDRHLFLLRSAVLCGVLGALAAPCGAVVETAARSGSEVAAQEPSASDAQKPRRSFWSLVRFRKAGSEESAPHAATPSGTTTAPQATERTAGAASPRALSRVGTRLRTGVAGNDPVIRTFLDKIDRGAASSADLNAFASYLARKGMTQDALSYQTEAVRIDRDNATLLLNLGTLQRDLGHGSAAMSAYRRALALDPNNALAHYNAGTLLDADGDYDRAVEEYKTALTLDPSLADPVKNPQVVNNDRLMVVNLLLYRQRAGALGLPLVAVPGAAESKRPAPPASRNGAPQGRR